MSEGFVVRARKEIVDVLDKYRDGLTIAEALGLLQEVGMHVWSLSCKMRCAPDPSRPNRGPEPMWPKGADNGTMGPDD